jgi:hypothetical protein
MPAIAADFAPMRPQQLGIAVDVQIYDDKGRAAPNNKGSWSYGIYEKYYQSAIARAQNGIQSRPSLFIACSAA